MTAAIRHFQFFCLFLCFRPFLFLFFFWQLFKETSVISLSVQRWRRRFTSLLCVLHIRRISPQPLPVGPIFFPAEEFLHPPVRRGLFQEELSDPDSLVKTTQNIQVSRKSYSDSGLFHDKPSGLDFRNICSDSEWCVLRWARFQKNRL